jgi:hypothetical protein
MGISEKGMENSVKVRILVGMDRVIQRMPIITLSTDCKIE